jgi:Peptidase family M23
MADQVVLRWPVDNRIINRRFGEFPELYKQFGLPGHEGIDLYADTGDNVHACADGRVSMAGSPPKHPYGTHIRIQSKAGTTSFETIYGHLEQILVQVGQQVTAGDVIGLADNTGNSTGSHLHITLKITGKSTPGYPAGIVDPLPYLSGQVIGGGPGPGPGPGPAPEELTDIIVFPSDKLPFYSGPAKDAALWGLLTDGEPLRVMGNAEQAKQAIGKTDVLIKVKRRDGNVGWVVARLVRTTGGSLPPTGLAVVPTTDGLNVRARPMVEAFSLGLVTPMDTLTVLGDEKVERPKIGQQFNWMNVKTPQGWVGYVAAWYVRPADAVAFGGPVMAFVPAGASVKARLNTYLRKQPAPHSPRQEPVKRNDELVVISDPDDPPVQIGQKGDWVFVETAGGERGWLPSGALVAKK